LAFVLRHTSSRADDGDLQRVGVNAGKYCPQKPGERFARIAGVFKQAVQDLEMSEQSKSNLDHKEQKP